MSEYDDNDSLQRYFIYGNYIDEPLIMNDTSNDYYYAHDHLYGTAALTDSAGDVVERCEYDAYGNIYVMDSNYNPRAETSYGNPYYFTGRRLDTMDTGSLKLQYSRARYYDPETGRFLQKDPLGVNPAGGEVNPFNVAGQYKDGMNVYEYVKSQPIIGMDSYGLKRYYPPDSTCQDKCHIDWQYDQIDCGVAYLKSACFNVPGFIVCWWDKYGKHKACLYDCVIPGLIEISTSGMVVEN